MTAHQIAISIGRSLICVSLLQKLIKTKINLTYTLSSFLLIANFSERHNHVSLLPFHKIKQINQQLSFSILDQPFFKTRAACVCSIVSRENGASVYFFQNISLKIINCLSTKCRNILLTTFLGIVWKLSVPHMNGSIAVVNH